MLIVMTGLGLSGCGTMNPCVPGRPLDSGTTEGRIGLTLNTNNFKRLSAQLGFYWGVSNHDVVGLSFNGPLPSRLTYAHYFAMAGEESRHGNLQAHIGYVLAPEFNPTYEIDLGMAALGDSQDQSITLGLGYYGKPWMLYAEEGLEVHTGLSPILRYTYQADKMQAEVSYIPGLTKFAVESAHWRPDSAPAPGVVIPHDEVRSIEQQGDDPATADWVIHQASGNTIQVVAELVSNCMMGREGPNKMMAAYVPSSEHRAFWMINDLSRRHEPLVLNMEAILAEYEAGGDLRLVPDEDVLIRSQQQVSTPWHDLSVFVGSRDRR